jgi:hypothetical protein
VCTELGNASRIDMLAQLAAELRQQFDQGLTRRSLLDLLGEQEGSQPDLCAEDACHVIARRLQRFVRDDSGRRRLGGPDRGLCHRTGWHNRSDGRSNRLRSHRVAGSMASAPAGTSINPVASSSSSTASISLIAANCWRMLSTGRSPLIEISTMRWRGPIFSLRSSISSRPAWVLTGMALSNIGISSCIPVAC